jgi:NAD(P)-dependent dehydrogenase (short-subunit alcohol dehydrogenase family)
MTLISFENQVVLVTGAGRGLGAEYAKLFAKRDAIVVVHDAGVNRDGTGSDPGPALSVAESIRKNGGTAFVETLNLSDQCSCNTLINNIENRFGRLDVLVHSAGLVAYKGIEDTTDEEWNRLLQINIEAPFWLSRAAWPIMKRQQYGRIVLTVSGYGLKTFDDSDVTAYGVGKAAQFGLMNGLAGEGMKHGILVNAISPVAATRIFRAAVAPNEYSPASVAPGVVMLGSTLCRFSGKVLQAVDGRFALAEFMSLKEIDLGPYPTPEEVLQKIEIESS